MQWFFPKNSILSFKLLENRFIGPQSYPEEILIVQISGRYVNGCLKMIFNNTPAQAQGSKVAYFPLYIFSDFRS